MSKNCELVSVGEEPRTELHDRLGLTGCEVSVNRLPAGAAVPFVHAFCRAAAKSGSTVKCTPLRRATGSA